MREGHVGFSVVVGIGSVVELDDVLVVRLPEVEAVAVVVAVRPVDSVVVWVLSGLALGPQPRLAVSQSRLATRR
jgi:hypothetical protein